MRFVFVCLFLLLERWDRRGYGHYQRRGFQCWSRWNQRYCVTSASQVRWPGSRTPRSTTKPSSASAVTDTASAEWRRVVCMERHVECATRGHFTGIHGHFRCVRKQWVCFVNAPCSSPVEKRLCVSSLYVENTMMTCCVSLNEATKRSVCAGDHHCH